jgi:hypothetical protein
MVADRRFKQEEAIVTLLGESLAEFIGCNPKFINHALAVFGKSLNQA